MEAEGYKYQDRAVVFLDVLGFEEKLRMFEDQAISMQEQTNSEYYISESLNEFISTFKEAVSFLDKDDYSYYLFSDNICITIDYISNHNRLIDILVTISDLFLEFAEKGYFLRGGLEVGKFVDEKAIAVGIPLANAYRLEQNVAIYPRIVISERYRALIDSFEENQSLSEKSISLKKYLIKNHCEVYYINTFFSLVSKSDKVNMFTTIRKAIFDNLEANKKVERIAIKFEWLASEFDSFIDSYSNEIKFLETETTNEEDVETITSLKLLNNGK